MDFKFDLSVDTVDIVVRMLLSMVIGGAIGWERASRSKPAGLRTHILVALGSTIFTLIMLEIYGAMETGEGRIGQPDPLRIVEAIASGLGFLGAGCIIRERGAVEGLTTASSLWISGALGVACGVGHFVIAGFAIFFVMTTLIGLRKIRGKAIPVRSSGGAD